MSRRRRISPQAAARRSLLIDGLVAIGLVVLAFQLAAGVGIVGVLALLALLVLTASIGIEAVLRRRRPGAERLRESMRDG